MAPLEQKLLALVESGRLPHGVALVGGTQEERRALAIRLAQRLVCEKENACGGCGPCNRVASGSSEALLTVEPDGAQIKLEQAKLILDFLSLKQVSKARLVIIDPVQLLNPQAANALLKSLEEPPAGSYFICLCPSVSLLLPTFRSRLQAFRLPYRVERLELAEGEIRAATVKAFHGLSRQDRAAWSDLVDFVKDKESALAISRNLQQLSRQAVVESGMGGDARILDWWRGFFQMEMDILANLDRTLLFENFYYQAHA